MMGTYSEIRGTVSVCLSQISNVSLFLSLQKFEDHSQSDDEDNKFSSFAPTAENTFVPSSDSDGETGVSHADCMLLIVLESVRICAFM